MDWFLFWFDGWWELTILHLISCFCHFFFHSFSGSNANGEMAGKILFSVFTKINPIPSNHAILEKQNIFWCSSRRLRLWWWANFDSEFTRCWERMTIRSEVKSRWKGHEKLLNLTTLNKKMGWTKISFQKSSLRCYTQTVVLLNNLAMSISSQSVKEYLNSNGTWWVKISPYHQPG